VRSQKERDDKRAELARQLESLSAEDFRVRNVVRCSPDEIGRCGVCEGQTGARVVLKAKDLALSVCADCLVYAGDATCPG